MLDELKEGGGGGGGVGMKEKEGEAKRGGEGGIKAENGEG